MIKKLTKEVIQQMLASITPQATGRTLVADYIVVGYRQKDGYKLTVQNSERGSRCQEVNIVNDVNLGLIGLLNGNKAVAVRI